MTRRVLHLWRGDVFDFPVCAMHRMTVHGTRDPEAVTCKRCLQWMAEEARAAMSKGLLHYLGERGKAICGLPNGPGVTVQLTRIREEVTCPHCAAMLAVKRS